MYGHLRISEETKMQSTFIFNFISVRKKRKTNDRELRLKKNKKLYRVWSESLKISCKANCQQITRKCSSRYFLCFRKKATQRNKSPLLPAIGRQKKSDIFFFFF